MSKHRPTTKEEHVNYCLRKLGDGILEINVTPDQIEDCVQESLQYFRDHHPDANFRSYLPHQITDSDASNGYIQLNNPDVDVISVFPIDHSGISSGIFGLKYQIFLQDIVGNSGYADIAYYEQMQQYLSLLDMKLSGTVQIQYSKQQDKLFLLGEKGTNDLIPGKYLMIEVAIDESDSDNSTTTRHSIWNHEFLKEYTTLLIKKMWGTNLSKFEGITLPGGITLNGKDMKDEAKEEIEKLMEKFRSEQEVPPSFFVG